MDMKKQWDALHDQKRFRPAYPQDRVVAWTFRNFSKDAAQQFKLLDVGCGAGRHAIFWASEGYPAYGCDFSQTGIDEAAKIVERNGLRLAACQCEADELPYDDNHYDGVLCFGVLYYLPYGRYQKAVSEIHRVLKPGGRAFIVTRSQEDSRALQGRKLDATTYLIDEGNPFAPSGAEGGMAMTMLGRDEVAAMFSGFSEVSIDRSTVTSNNGNFTDDDWLVYVVK